MPETNPIKEATRCFDIVKKIIDFTNKEMARIENDERYHYEPALVQINAPLALIQLEMESEMAILKKIHKIIFDSVSNEKR